MSEGAYTRNLAIGAVVLVAFLVVGVAWRLLVQPTLDDELIGVTSGSSQYTHKVTIQLDAFSGYAPIRSRSFSTQLRDRGIKLELVDDQADYGARVKALKRGTAQMAVFTVDGWVAMGAELGEFPGAIVGILDETRGADAIVAFKDAVPDLRALDVPGGGFVLTPASPSEFLARVALAEFGLRQTSRQFVEADGAADVLAKMKRAKRGDRTGYVLWEPYVSQALEDPDAHTIFDSSQITGYIVDVMVAERGWLRDNPQVARAVMETWLRTVYEARRAPTGLVDLVLEDAAAGGDAISRAQAEKVVSGIKWPNTLENYGYFGLVSRGRTQGVLHLEDAIANITGVLVRTGALPSDPIGENAHELYFPGVLEGMMNADFHPGQGLGVATSGLGTAELDAAAAAAPVEALDDAAWGALIPVGSMVVSPISFGRAKATIHVQGKRDLADLARRLRSLPSFYLTVVGQAVREGDPDANLALAEARAKAVREQLVADGVEAARVRAVSQAPGASASSSTVRFELGQKPY